MQVGAAPTAEPWSRWDWTAAGFLFLATAGVVLWQNSRLAVLWDLSYILENSYRISLGDLPYRDFVLPYAPLTFLTQAGLIKITGRAFFHHAIYCAVVGGIATVLTWRVAFRMLDRRIERAWEVAFLLSLPLIVLGIYCVFPHPFYDPDCTFAILISVFLLQKLERRNLPPPAAFFTGALLVVPLFVKQNTGLAFLASALLGLLTLIGIGFWRGPIVRGYAWVLAGAVAGLASAMIFIHVTVGLGTYTYWTFRFAASRRLPPLQFMIAIYRDPFLPAWLGALLAGVSLWWLNKRRSRSLGFVSGLLMSLPFAWASIYLIFDKDSSNRADRLLSLWPFLLIVSLALALANAWPRPNISSLLPFVLIATVHGAFLSQQVWGSTYAIWPLLVLLLACAIAGFNRRLPVRAAWQTVTYTFVIAISITIAGAFYIWSHERLDYANLDEGEIARSNLPALAGLSVRGPWIPQFEELVDFANREIPREDGLLMIPGEDLFYYTTGRHSRFPVLMFDHTVDPYTSREIVNLARARNIRWLVVKRDLQLGNEPVEDKEQLLSMLRQEFEAVESLDNYDIYRRNR